LGKVFTSAVFAASLCASLSMLAMKVIIAVFRRTSWGQCYNFVILFLPTKWPKIFGIFDLIHISICRQKIIIITALFQKSAIFCFQGSKWIKFRSLQLPLKWLESVDR
jgi:hypothetical protein